jgi:hypothetical protein
MITMCAPIWADHNLVVLTTYIGAYGTIVDNQACSQCYVAFCFVV